MKPSVRPDSAEAGFTLVEVVVALTLSVLVVGLVGGAYLFAVRAVGAWQDRIDLEDTAHVIHQRLSADLRRAEAVALLAPDSMEVVEPGGQHAYAYRDSTLYRDGLALTRSPLAVRAFAVRRFTSDGGVLADTSAAPGGPAYVEVTFQLASMDTTADGTVTRTASAALRVPARWSPRP